MQRSTRRKPEDDRGSNAHRAGSYTSQGFEDDEPPITVSQDLRHAARAFDESSAADDDDAFFAQFKKQIQADKHEMLKAIQTRQQEASDADAALLAQIRGPVADALRPRVPAAAQRGASQLAGGVAAPPSSATVAVAACPVAAAGARILQASKQLLADYEKAARVVEGHGEGAAGRLGDRWPADVEKLRSLLDVGYRKAQDDVARVLRGHGDGGGGEGEDEDEDGGGGGGCDTGGAKTGGNKGLGKSERDEAEALFASGREKRGQRERFNVTEALCEASRGVRRLSRSLPPDLLE